MVKESQVKTENKRKSHSNVLEKTKGSSKKLKIAEDSSPRSKPKKSGKQKISNEDKETAEDSGEDEEVTVKASAEVEESSASDSDSDTVEQKEVKTVKTPKDDSSSEDNEDTEERSGKKEQRKREEEKANSDDEKANTDGEKANSDDDAEKDETEEETTSSRKRKSDKNTKSGKRSPEDSKKITTPKGQSRYVLFVGNISWDTSKESINEHFKKVGKIVDVRIPLERETNRPRGFAYVELGDQTSYQNALSLHDSMLDNRRIKVEYTQGGKNKGDANEIRAKNFKLHGMRQRGQFGDNSRSHSGRQFRDSGRDHGGGGSSRSRRSD